MKVLLDDTAYYIEFESDIYEDFRCNTSYQFVDCRKILLTYKQEEKFISNETNREFNVSEKKVIKVLEYMKDNIWND